MRSQRCAPPSTTGPSLWPGPRPGDIVGAGDRASAGSVRNDQPPAPGTGFTAGRESGIAADCSGTRGGCAGDEGPEQPGDRREPGHQRANSPWTRRQHSLQAQLPAPLADCRLGGSTEPRTAVSELIGAGQASRPARQAAISAGTCADVSYRRYGTIRHFCACTRAVTS